MSRKKEDDVIIRNKNIGERYENRVNKNLLIKNLRNEEHIK